MGTYLYAIVFAVTASLAVIASDIIVPDASAQSVQLRQAGAVQLRQAEAVRPREAQAVPQRNAQPPVVREPNRGEPARPDSPTVQHQGAVRPGAGNPFNPCAPNCGTNFSTGQQAPTIYSPAHNYSPYGN